MTDDCKIDKGLVPHISSRVGEVMTKLLDEPLPGQLYLVATPIGNLGDITLRALAVLARADVIAVEDTRRSRVLLQHFGISAEMINYHDHNGAEMRPRILAMIKAGKSVALISDAGMPLISDPGYKLANYVRGGGGSVEVVPGASAVMAALSLSGLPTDRFLFEGFLPPKQKARQGRFLALRDVQASLVFFETVKRVQAFLSDLQACLGERDVALCRELTKLHQEVIEGRVADVLDEVGGRDLKGELVIVVGPALEAVVSDDEIEVALQACYLSGLSMRDCTQRVVEELGVAKKRVYGLSLQVKKRLEGED